MSSKYDRQKSCKERKENPWLCSNLEFILNTFRLLKYDILERIIWYQNRYHVKPKKKGIWIWFPTMGRFWFTPTDHEWYQVMSIIQTYLSFFSFSLFFFFPCFFFSSSLYQSREKMVFYKKTKKVNFLIKKKKKDYF